MIMLGTILPRKLLKSTPDGLNAVSTSHVLAASLQIEERKALWFKTLEAVINSYSFMHYFVLCIKIAQKSVGKDDSDVITLVLWLINSFLWQPIPNLQLLEPLRLLFSCLNSLMTTLCQTFFKCKSLSIKQNQKLNKYLFVFCEHN